MKEKSNDMKKIRKSREFIRVQNKGRLITMDGHPGNRPRIYKWIHLITLHLYSVNILTVIYKLQCASALSNIIHIFWVNEKSERFSQGQMREEKYIKESARKEMEVGNTFSLGALLIFT